MNEWLMNYYWDDNKQTKTRQPKTKNNNKWFSPRLASQERIPPNFPPTLAHDDSEAGGCPFQVTWNSTEIALTSRRNLRSPQLQISSHSSFLFELDHGLFCRRDQPCQEIWVEGGQCFKRFEHQTLKDRKKWKWKPICTFNLPSIKGYDAN